MLLSHDTSFISVNFVHLPRTTIRIGIHGIPSALPYLSQ